MTVADNSRSFFPDNIEAITTSFGWKDSTTRMGFSFFFPKWKKMGLSGMSLFLREVIFFSWRRMDELLSEILRGGKKAGYFRSSLSQSIRNVRRDISKSTRSHSGVVLQVSYRDAVLGGKRSTNLALFLNVKDQSWIEES